MINIVLRCTVSERSRVLIPIYKAPIHVKFLNHHSSRENNTRNYMDICSKRFIRHGNQCTTRTLLQAVKVGVLARNYRHGLRNARGKTASRVLNALVNVLARLRAKVIF